jgi:hypothetical protein
MVALQTEQNTAAWRVLLFASNGSELLVLSRPSGFCLPVLHIPSQERIAANLNAEAQRLWNIDTVCVAPFDVPHPERISGDARYHVMEVRNPEELLRIAPRAMNVAALQQSAFADVRDYVAVCCAMKLDATDSPQDSQGPFSGFGAFRQISNWVEEQLQPLGRQWNGAFRQLHASGSFALIRFQTNRGAAWFKATGEPNRREHAITHTLSTLFPKYMAELIAVHRDWNAWLSDEMEGADLDSTPDLTSWCCAAKSLAELQVASIEHTSPILSQGAHDSRIAKLLPQVVPFFATMQRLTEAQVKTTTRRLSAQEIQIVQLRLTEALSEMEAAAIPDTLNHFDMNPGNAIVRHEECKFLDWAEAAIGNPFLSFEYLRQHFVRALGDDPEGAIEFRDSYVNVWRRLLPHRAIKRTLELMPLIAPFALAATLPWNDIHRNAEPEFAGFLRSLARRMHREAGQFSRCAA